MKHLKELKAGDKFEVPGLYVGKLIKTSLGSCWVRLYPKDEDSYNIAISKNTEVRKIWNGK